MYTELLQLTRKAWSKHSLQKDMDKPEFSYNMGMTTSAIILCPRMSEGHVLHRHDGTEQGFVGLNGSFLSGGVLVKQKEDFDYLQTNPQALEEVLKQIGVPSTLGLESVI
jgi:ATP adenylyltransferase/5',5'''-P-1,P-4-tetraphosphate phosphorylase II